MHASRLALLTVGVLQLSLALATAAPITLYDGSSTPNQQGWSETIFGTGTVITSGGTTEFDTTNLYGNFNTYARATGAIDFIVSIDLQVLASNYKYENAGILFGGYSAPELMGEDRMNSLTIGDGMLFWGDLEGGSVTVDTSVFHEYALRYLHGNLDLFVDASFDSIANGTAVAALSRPGLVPMPGMKRGRITFGDASMAAGINSRFIVDSVKFQDLTPTTPVPEPASLTLLAGGLLVHEYWRRRRVHQR
jgi:hypothetical protein